MRIRDILTGTYQKVDRNRSKDLENADIQRKKGADGTSQVRKGDSTEISSEARELQQAARLIDESVQILKAMPEVRSDAVEIARERVASGYYDQPHVMEEIAGILSEHLEAESPVSPSDLATDIISNISPDNVDLTRADLQEIKGYLEQGLYQDEEVIEEVAQRIYNFLQNLPEE